MSTSISRSISLTLGLASTPPLAIACFGLLLGIGVPPVTEWFWPTPTTNLAEAAALGDAARVLALATEGIPLDEPLPVRQSIRATGAPEIMTPIEAAMRHGRDEVVELLRQRGARLPEGTADPTPAAAP
jgi:hypothetical protein